MYGGRGVIAGRASRQQQQQQPEPELAVPDLTSLGYALRSIDLLSHWEVMPPLPPPPLLLLCMAR